MRGDAAWWALAALVVLRQRRDRVPPADWGEGWVFPAPDLDVPARVSQEFRAPGHMGVDIAYLIGGRWTAPQGTPVLAARAGRVWSVTSGERGTAVVIDHGAPWATFYQHLSAASVAPGDVVDAGQRIGTMGADPTDPEGVVHLHFATWYRGSGDGASVDPGAMATWRRVKI